MLPGCQSASSTWAASLYCAPASAPHLDSRPAQAENALPWLRPAPDRCAVAAPRTDRALAQSTRQTNPIQASWPAHTPPRPRNSVRSAVRPCSGWLARRTRRARQIRRCRHCAPAAPAFHCRTPDNKYLRRFARDPQHPFRVKGRGDAARLRRRVFQPQVDHLDGRVRRDKDSHLLAQQVAVVLEDGIACAVSNQIGCRCTTRQRRRRPHLGRFFVAQIDRFARRIGDRIVRPGRQAVLAAVASPGIARAGLGHHETEIRIGNHIDPRRGRLLAWLEVDHVLAPSALNPPRPLSNCKSVGRSTGPSESAGVPFRLKTLVGTSCGR